MNLKERKALLSQLRNYMLSDEESWEQAKENAFIANPWFLPEFIDLSIENITGNYLDEEKLEQWINQHAIPEKNLHPKKVGIVMAGNIPMVGFHDLLSVFVSGHYALIKLSSKDNILIKHLVEMMQSWKPELSTSIKIAETLKSCDAYIATGSNNSSRYFDYYFQKYPHIIRRNRTSVAILTGAETPEELNKLADDIHLYFGLGCRNVTKIYVPVNYNFQNLLEALKKYDYFMDHYKYKNNFDYMFSIHLLNQTKYITEGHVLLVEEQSLYSPISQLNYEYYTDDLTLKKTLENHPQLQCIVGKSMVEFGQAQSPGLTDHADGVDTLAFVKAL